MSDFGFWELALILFVALLVVGPDRLPALAATLGRWVGRARNIAAQFKADFMSETRADDLKSIMGQTRDAFDSAQQSISETGAEVNRALRNTDPLVQSIEDQIESGRFAADNTDDTAADTTSGDTGNATATAAAADTAGNSVAPGGNIGDTAPAVADDTTPATAVTATEYKRTAGNTASGITDTVGTPAATNADSTTDNPPAPQHETDARRQDPPVRRD